jgi:hypothetical protein
MMNSYLQYIKSLIPTQYRMTAGLNRLPESSEISSTSLYGVTGKPNISTRN